MPERRRASDRAPSRTLVGAVAALASLLAVAPAAASPPPWLDSFEADAAAIAAAAAALPEPEDGAEFLYAEYEIRLESDLRTTVRARQVFRVSQAARLDEWSTARAFWAPWHQERPEMRARVIHADGREHRLDPATISEQPVPALDATLFTDQRMLEAPLPGVEPGAVVLVEIVQRDRAPRFGAGVTDRYPFGSVVPTILERLVIDVPQGLSFRFETQLLDREARREEVDGRVRWTWEMGPLEARVWPLDVPGDVAVVPAVAYSAGGSWQEVSAAYARWVDERIAGWSAPEEVRRQIAAADGRRAKVAAALSWLHREVRYVALELGDTELVPRSPADTLARKYGDCKDQSTLLVAVLREAGFDAEVALLATGPGQDVHPDLPGMGLFDHAIVHLPPDDASGEPELWIDATVAEIRLGQLPPRVRGRRALLVRADGGELRTTPTTVSSDHGIDIEQVVHLADWGPARETIEERYRGDFEWALRVSLPELLAAEDSDFRGAEIVEPPPEDRSQPLIVRNPVREEAGFTNLEWAEYGIDQSLLFRGLHAALVPKEAAEERRLDLHVATPYVHRVRLHLVPPAGFEPFELPEDEEREVGVARYERRVEAAGDGSVTVELRFDSGPSRLTPAEVAATRQAIDELGFDEALAVRFRSRGQALLGQGRVEEAVRELRRVAEAEPRPARRARLAHALLIAGLGESARREARAAVELDGDSAIAHQTLGVILAHDLFGRLLRPGFDPQGAERALRRAVELDPEDTASRISLAWIFEHGDDGTRYGPGARLDEAIELYRTLRDEHGMKEYAPALLAALWRTGRFEEARTLAAEATSAEARAYLIAAIALDRGAPAALGEAARSADAEVRRQHLSEAASLLVAARSYPLAAELAAASAQGASDAADLLATAAMLRRLKRHETVEPAPADPRWAVFRAVRALLLEDEDEIEALREEARRAGEVEGDVFGNGGGSFRASGPSGETLMTPDVALDLWNAGFEVERSGSPEVGYRLVLQNVLGGRDTWYLAAGPGGRPVVIAYAARSAPGEECGRQALRHLKAGRLDAARQWLDWELEYMPTADPDDPWSGHAFALLWPAGEAAGEAAIRRAAWSLLHGEPEVGEAVDELAASLAAAEDEKARRALELALASAYDVLERWDDIARLVRGWAEQVPTSEQAYIRLSHALYRLGDREGSRQLAMARLALDPDHRRALRNLRRLEALEGDLAASRRHAERLVALGGDASDLVALVRLALLDGTAGEATVGIAYRAVQRAEGWREKRSALRALATLLAELDRPLEAKDVILQALDLDEQQEPDDAEWYVFGRIAETYGELDAARADYHRVEPPERRDPFATWHLAQRRLAALDARPAGAMTAGSGPEEALR